MAFHVDRFYLPTWTLPPDITPIYPYMEFGGVVPDPLDRVLYCYWLKRVALNTFLGRTQPYTKSTRKYLPPLRKQCDILWVSTKPRYIFHVTDSAVNSEPPIFNDLAKFSVRKKPFWHISGKLSKNRVYNEYVIIQVAEPNPYLAYLARLCSQTRLTFSNGPLASISCRIVSSRVESAPAIL